MGARYSTHFAVDEFRCNHCGKLPANGMDPALIGVLEYIRRKYQSYIKINSGYRCPDHNAAVGGAKNSMHLYGLAADFVVVGTPVIDVWNWMTPWHFGGLGRYNTFTHVDIRDSRARW